MTNREEYTMKELRRFNGARMAYANRTYEEYDPRYACNGGSYYQPHYAVIFADGTFATADYNVCGDFGGFITVEIVKGGTKFVNFVDTRDGEEDLTVIGIGEEFADYLVALHEITRRRMRFINHRGEECFIG